MKVKMDEFGLRHRCFYSKRSPQRLWPVEGVENGALFPALLKSRPQALPVAREALCRAIN
jgi:hypothetical protein